MTDRVDTASGSSHHVIVLTPHEDPEILAAVRRYVMPDRRYAKLHGWNLMHMAENLRAEFGESLSTAAAQITNREVILLLRSDWRARLTAAWLVGITRRTEFRPLIRRLLSEEDASEAVKGLSFALARFGTREDADILVSYLDRALLPGADHGAQPWAMAALLRLDRETAGDRATRLTDPEGPWTKWSNGAGLPAEYRLIDFLCEFATSHEQPPTGGPSDGTRNPMTLFAGWSPAALPSAWHIIASESERRRRDKELRTALDEHDPLSQAAPLSVAECTDCRAILFSSTLGRPNWAVARIDSPARGAAGEAAYELFGDPADSGAHSGHRGRRP